MRATSREELSYQYFPFYVQAYLDSLAIGVLSMGAEACYHRLIARQWKAHSDDTALPLDANHLRLLTKATPAEWRDIWAELEGLFPVTADGRGRRNPELSALWAERVAYLEQQKANGRKGGRPRNPEQTDGLPVGSEKAHKAKPNTNPEETHGFSLGSDRVSKNAQNGNPTETSKLLVTPLSPPPSGGGASPAAPRMRVLPGGKGNSTPVADPFAGPPEIDRDALLSAVPEAQRAVVTELLEGYARPAKWAAWIRELTAYVEPGDEASGVPIGWDALGQGLRELLLINPEGQRITPAQVETFGRAVWRRTLRAGLVADVAVAEPPADAPVVDAFAEYAADRASEGDPAFIAVCREQGIPFTAKEIA